MSYLDTLSTPEFRTEWALTSASRGMPQHQPSLEDIDAASLEADRILAMSHAEIAAHVESQGLTIEGEAAIAKKAFRRALAAAGRGMRVAS